MSQELSTRYDPKTLEEKWLKIWDEKRAFHATANTSQKGSYTIVIPPPNVTGILHMGHALNNTLQDIAIRTKRMQGYDTLWMPGTDHAGIATQNVVEKQLAEEGKTRHDIGREAMTERLWAWKQEYGNTILTQLRKLGASCDWDRTAFTMDDDYAEAVRDVFVHLYKKGLIYRGQRIINWCPRCHTALSDEEAEHQEKNGKLYHFRYHFKNDPEQSITVATTRPETYLGDTAVAVHPEDPRYTKLIGETLVLPLINREITIIADDFVDPEFGTGAVKVTPAHDPNDFAMGERHQLECINIMNEDATLNYNAGRFAGMDRFDARHAIVSALDEEGYLVRIDEHHHAVGHCYRCDTVVEPYLSKQWFVKMKPLADRALNEYKKGKPVIQPSRWQKVYENWLTGIRDWCISRQIWWGHRIPIWYDDEGNEYCGRNLEEAQAQAGGAKNLTQDPDVLDTWFSSWLWPFATLHWESGKSSEKQNTDLTYFYPTAALFTAPEILFFWVARMVMAGLEFMDAVPFQDVILHGTVRDEQGRKMSKSLGNSIDPLDVIDQYGADSLRFSMILNSGQDIYISMDKFEIGRNFCNKLWNATRLVLMNVSNEAKDVSLDQLQVDQLDTASQWIVSRFYDTLSRVNPLLDDYKYSVALEEIYSFFWNNYCDWYLECIKTKWDQPAVQQTAYVLLEQVLKLLHPFIPFITEELYAMLKHRADILMTASWPEENSDQINRRLQDDMEHIFGLISEIRQKRAQAGLAKSETLSFYYVVNDDENRHLFNDIFGSFRHLAGIAQSTVTDERPGNSLPVFYGKMGGYLMSDKLDITKIMSDLKKKQEQTAKILQGIQKKLSNPSFTDKAPQNVVDGARKQAEENAQLLAKIEQELKELS